MWIPEHIVLENVEMPALFFNLSLTIKLFGPLTIFFLVK